MCSSMTSCLRHVYVRLPSAAASNKLRPAHAQQEINVLFFSAQNVTITNENIKLNSKLGKRSLEYVTGTIAVTTSLSGSAWDHCLFHCLPSPQSFNSNFHETDASYIHTLSPKCYFSVSRIHGGQPSVFSNFDGTPPLKPTCFSLSIIYSRSHLSLLPDAVYD